MANLALLCPQHHRLKTLGHWQAHQAATHNDTPAPEGTLEWTAPSGRKHTTYPEPDPPPPF